jgi:hypothetical protein
MDDYDKEEEKKFVLNGLLRMGRSFIFIVSSDRKNVMQRGDGKKYRKDKSPRDTLFNCRNIFQKFVG